MKKTVYDISEMSDSKEVYGQRPNPFLSWFIYTVTALLVGAVIYACVGKIELSARASGVVRPNEAVSTVSALTGGRITAVHYEDGQMVQAGDVLLSVDSSELEISLEGLKQTRADSEKKLQMLEKFLDGIVTGKNPFSSNPRSEEYTYFTQYQNYELTRENTKDSFLYDVKTASADLAATEEELAEIAKQISGLSAFRDSIEQGKNLLGSYPDHEKEYLLYVSRLSALEGDYKSKREQIERDQTTAYRGEQKKTLIEQKKCYEGLISSIEAGEDRFPAEYQGDGRLLWQDFQEGLAKYQRDYDSAAADYQYYADGGSLGQKPEEILAFDETMLEGYRLFRRSVEEGRDCFEEGKDSYFYRSLYTEYKEKYDGLLTAGEGSEESSESARVPETEGSPVQETEADQTQDTAGSAEQETESAFAQETEDAQTQNTEGTAEQDTESASAQETEPPQMLNTEGADNPESESIPAQNAATPLSETGSSETETEGNKDSEKQKSAEKDCAELRARTLAEIDNSILQIQASIAEKKLAIEAEALDYNAEQARIRMESAQAGISAYKNRMLLQYRQNLSDCDVQTAELNKAIAEGADKNTLLNELEKSYQDSREQEKLKILSQIESSISSLKSQQVSKEGSRRIYEMVTQRYQSETDGNGEPISLKLSDTRQVESLLTQEEQLRQQMSELEPRIRQLEKQIEQASVKAGQSGIVNAFSTLVVGDGIAAGTTFATIIPQGESEFKVQIYVSNADIAGVEVGSAIRYDLAALPRNQYGTVNGRVLSVSKDAVMQDGQYSGFFLVEGSMESGILTDRNGNSGEITPGMQTEARIVTQEKTILRYLLDKIDLN